MAEWEDRQTKRVPLPPTDEEKEAFEAFEKSYSHLLEYGMQNGWLDWGYEGHFVVGPKPSGYETREETDEEYERRMNSSMAKMHWTLQRIYLDAMNREKVSLKRLLEAQEVDLTSRGGTVTFPVVKRDSFGKPVVP